MIVYAGFFFAGWTSDAVRRMSVVARLVRTGDIRGPDGASDGEAAPVAGSQSCGNGVVAPRATRVPGSDKGVDSNQIIDPAALEQLAGYTITRPSTMQNSPAPPATGLA